MLSGPLDHDVNAQTDLQPDEDEIIIDLTGGLYATEGDDDPAIIQSRALRLVIEDDAVEISGLDDTGILAFAATSSGGDSGFVGYGGDGAGSLAITDFTTPLLPVDSVLGTISGEIVGGELIYTSSEFGEIIKVTADGSGMGSYLVDVLQDAPLVKQALIDGATTPGGPIETFDLPVGSSPPLVTFDGFLFTNPTASLSGQYTAGNLPAGSADDVNISNQGAALADNQFDKGEGLALFFNEDVAGLEFIIQGGTGGKTTVSFYVEGYRDGVLVYEEDYLNKGLPKGNNELKLEFLSDVGDMDAIYIVSDISAPNGYRIPEIFAFTYADIPDLTGSVTLTATDADFDTKTDTFDFFIDGTDVDAIV